jgi:REP-associated tyrosine transposase
MRLPFEERTEPVRAFWQARFYDFKVYGEGKRIDKLNYMHQNPMKRKLVAHPKEWPWSSWGFYAGATKVLVQIDAGK